MYMRVQMYMNACISTCECMYPYVHVYMYVCMYVCMYVHMYIYIYVDTDTQKCAYVPLWYKLCISTYTYAYMHLSICRYKCVLVCMYVCLYMIIPYLHAARLESTGRMVALWGTEYMLGFMAYGALGDKEVGLMSKYGTVLTAP